MQKLKRLSRADRYEIQILGKVTIENDTGANETYLCNTVNVSLSGAFVETGSAIPVGSLLKYSFSIPGFNISVNLIGEVVRGEAEANTSRNKGLNRYGIIFLDMKEDDKIALESFLLQAKRKKDSEDREKE